MEIRSPKRNARIADARHLVWYVLYKRKHQRGHIAQEFGAHHSSVTVALQKISTNRTHPKFASRIQRIKEILKGE
jgi:chromosomal replication initiation ATPase DnaA